MIFARWNGLGCNGEKLHVGSHPEGSSAVMVGGGRALGLIVPKKEVVVTGSSWFVLAIGSSEAISMRVTKPLSDINIISGVNYSVTLCNPFTAPFYIHLTVVTCNCYCTVSYSLPVIDGSWNKFQGLVTWLSDLRAYQSPYHSHQRSYER